MSKTRDLANLVSQGSALADGSIQSSEITGTLVVANGGTGVATLTANNVILGNGTSAVQTVAPGASGNVLTSNGTTWTSATPVTGAMTLIGTTSVSSNEIIFTGLSGYDRYLLLVNNVVMSVASNSLQLQFGYGSTPTYIASGYFRQAVLGNNTTATATGTAAGNGTAAWLSYSPQNLSHTVNGFNFITGMTSGTYVSIIGSHSSATNANIDTTTSTVDKSSNNITALKIFNPSTGLSGGSITLYGLS